MKIAEKEVEDFFNEVVNSFFWSRKPEKAELTQLIDGTEIQHGFYSLKPNFIHVGYCNIFDERYLMFATEDGNWDNVVPIMYKRIGTWNVKYKNS